MDLTSISKNRQVLAPDVLKLPGLHLLGHNLSNRATMPLALHTHAGALEFVVALRGSECYFADGEMYSITGGDVFVSLMDQPHGNGGRPQGVSEIIWFQIDPRPADLLGLSPERAEKLRRQLVSLNTHLMKADRECLMLLNRSLSGFLKMENHAREYAASLFSSFLFRLLLLGRQGASGDAQIGQAIQYIEGNIDAELTFAELSSLCGLSLSGFKHKFKECTGKTPRDYINNRKIEKAKDLLKAGKTVTETAMALGFSSSEYFTVVFKKYTTLQPGQYRKDAGLLKAQDYVQKSAAH